MVIWESNARNLAKWDVKRYKQNPNSIMQRIELLKMKLEGNNLNLGMAFNLEDISCAEQQIATSDTKTWSYSNSVKALKNQIQEATKERMLIEFSGIEALRYFETIQPQREKYLNGYYYQLEEKQKKISKIRNEIYHSKNLQLKLDNTLFEMNMLQNQLNLLREMDNRRSNFRQGAELTLQSVNGELNMAKEELASIKKEMFQSMGAMDIMGTELSHIMEELPRLRKTNKVTELTILNLNSQLISATSRLKAAREAGNKDSAIASSLFLSLEKLKKKSEAAQTENLLINEEITSIKSENQTTESEMNLNEENLETAMHELETVVSLETVALEKLNFLTGNMAESRASSSSIHVSNFEHAYLTGNAVYAKEVADKKVAAAEAWIEALKASEKEIIIRIDLAHTEASELIRLEEEKKLPSNHDTRVNEAQNMKVTNALPRKSITKNGTFMPGRRTGYRLSKSSSTRRTAISDSIKLKKRKNIMETLSKLFRNKSA